jgi:hypothetical protein
MMKRIDISGQRFNSLIVLSEHRAMKCGHTEWLCRCDCGNLTWADFNKLKTGGKKSCGCKQGNLTHKGNTYDLSGDYGIGYTSKADSFLFDKESHVLIKEYTWHINSEGYVISSRKDNNGNIKEIKMHRLLLFVPNDMEVDHINRCKHDNRKSNLRVCTHQQNLLNQGQKGYSYRTKNRKFEARIKVDGKIKYLGQFATESDARKAFENAMTKFYGAEWL